MTGVTLSGAKAKNFSRVTPFSAHCISDHRISDQKVRTVVVRAIVRVRVRVMVKVWVRVRVRVRPGDAVVRNAVGRKVGNPSQALPCLYCSCVTLTTHVISPRAFNSMQYHARDNTRVNYKNVSTLHFYSTTKSKGSNSTTEIHTNRDSYKHINCTRAGNSSHA